ncbi:Rrf2 family transcriptional regulator [Sinorhizobium sp. 7-81]|uniref:RrF2 family transcriptional regulator n=1 Tax=Sinorhizobium sp. 8-89 TaxID=3049089 RepID=UPI0024C28ECD|nr:Rrf2 family transcriptional regulator [Sinorhizobium sp. 8-89]MDK1494721.1 Rrf2 family transcriptional regulator [Sinorhizobium sp. 8-89]
MAVGSPPTTTPDKWVGIRTCNYDYIDRSKGATDFHDLFGVRIVNVTKTVVCCRARPLVLSPINIIGVKDCFPMAHVSAGVEYAMHSLVFLSRSEELEQPPSARDLAALQKIPAEFVAKLFTKLQKAGIVIAREGIGGGFTLARPAEDITVLEVVEAVDGRKALFECKNIRAKCALFAGGTPDWAVEGVCSIHAVMLEAEQRTRDVLAAHTLASVARRGAKKAPSDYREQVMDWLAARTPRRARRAPTSQKAPEL